MFPWRLSISWVVSAFPCSGLQPGHGHNNGQKIVHRKEPERVEDQDRLKIPLIGEEMVEL